MCEYCEGRKDISDKVFDDGSTYSETIMKVSIGKNLFIGNCLEVITVEYENGEKRYPVRHNFNINYCPMCGRKLRKENK